MGVDGTKGDEVDAKTGNEQVSQQVSLEARSELSLDQVKPGEEVVIEEIPDHMAKTQFIRFGIGEGSTAVCHGKIPMGPIVVRKNRQEIAIGRELARRIRVRRGHRDEEPRHGGHPHGR